ncbi:uncharacterized protein isoform X1 [Leptinotarsa decemlineata]|uniref:uncharacterized protein isoform X1 n=1 Tax=Leptinotarsa decemlineata TaxID=7539 RepID=UPI003D30D7EB
MEMVNNNKKVRSSNFSWEEEMNLIQEIEKFKHILECKTTNKVTNAEKEEAWRKVLSSFNSRNIQVRSISQIKAKFDNLKTKARKDVAKQKSYMTGTGGGPAIKIDLDPVTEATLNIINMKTVVGLNNSLDSDFINDLGMDASSSVLKEELLKEYPQQYVDSEMTIIAAGEAKDEMSEISTQSIVPEFTEEIVLEENQISPPTSVTPSGSMSSKKQTHIKKKIDWSSYAPNNLKRKANGKLHPTKINPLYNAKEDYYKKKKELLEKTVEAEEKERSRRREREEEEHLKKMTLLDLEIKLKEKQLNKLNVS